MYSNSWVEISKSALIHNLKIFKKIIGGRAQNSAPVRLFPVIKSNAYGHGLIEIGKIIDQSHEADFLAVANLEEALELKKNGIKMPIIVLSYYAVGADLKSARTKSARIMDYENKIIEAIRQKIRLVVYRQDQIDLIAKIAKKIHQTAIVHIKVDLGTSRLGLTVGQIIPFIKSIGRYAVGADFKSARTKKFRNMFAPIYIEGLFGHFANVEEINQSFAIQQAKIFHNLIKDLEKNNILIPIKHLACSAGALMNKAYHFDAVRLGISLYGLWSLEDGHAIRKKYPLQPVLSWRTKVIQVKELPKGATIGYGRTYKSNKKIKIAVLPIGYWEGYDRKLSNQGDVLIKGRRCKIRGRVCMNLTMVDITGLNVKVGDRVTLLGTDGQENISAEELAAKIGTINYEVVTRINPLIKRIVN